MQQESKGDGIKQRIENENSKPTIGEFKRDNTKEVFVNKVAEKLSLAMDMMGFKQLPSDEARIRMFDTLAMNYSGLTIEEIELAFHLVSIGYVTIPNKTYKGFTLEYLCNILNSYKKYKSELRVKSRSNKDKRVKTQREIEADSYYSFANLILKSYDNFKKDSLVLKRHFSIQIIWKTLKDYNFVEITKHEQGLVEQRALNYYNEYKENQKLKSTKKREIGDARAISLKVSNCTIKSFESELYVELTFRKIKDRVELKGMLENKLKELYG